MTLAKSYVAATSAVSHDRMIASHESFTTTTMKTTSIMENAAHSRMPPRIGFPATLRRLV